MTAALPLVTTDLEPRIVGTPFLVMLDVDGTLAPITGRPEEATVPVETRRAVAALAARPDVHVALVSGRAAADARRMVAVANVYAIGNHGCEVIAPDGEATIDPAVAPYRERVSHIARMLAPHLSGVPGVILENKVWTLSIHYRLADPAIVPRLRSTVADFAGRQGLPVAEGKMVLEVRPPVRVNKGTAAFSLAARLGALAPGASLLYAGDDTTDEDAFRHLRAHAPNAVTIRIADQTADRHPSGTAAEFILRDTVAMRELLEWLATVR